MVTSVSTFFETTECRMRLILAAAAIAVVAVPSVAVAADSHPDRTPAT
jgi:hypothetical protein